MRLSSLVLAAAAAGAFGPSAAAQSAQDGPVLGVSPLSPTGGLKIFNPAGSVRLVGWEKDSVLVRGHVPRGARFVFNRATSPTARSIALGVFDFGAGGDTIPCDFVVYLPKRATVSLKTESADIDARDIAGSFYTVSGSVRLKGSATSVDVQSISGSVDVDVATAWARVRTGDGHLLLRGAPQDADASTITGTLDIASQSLMRGQFASVSGDIHYDGSPRAGAIFDFSNHSGAVDLLLAADVSGVFTLSSITGPIENALSSTRPAAAAPHSLRLVLGRGDAQIAVRTFKGPIRLRPQS